MFRKNISEINLKNFKKRDAFSKVFDFVTGDECRGGKILVLYGLSGTGKTTIMEQTLSEYPNPDECVMYEIEDGNDMEDIKYLLADMEKKDKKVILLDEITKLPNFINRSAVLPDLFAKEGMKIVVAGGDSLGFLFAENGELYDRVIKISTTHITYAEHCRVLGKTDMDDYIRYGGFMCEDNKSNVCSYETAVKYLNSAVSENIFNSLKKDRRDSSLDVLTLEELRIIIRKMVKIYCGKEKLYFDEEYIINDLAKKINADDSIKHEVSGNMLSKLEQYLMELDLLSVVREKEYRKQKNFDDYVEIGTKYEYHVVQPALKYYYMLHNNSLSGEQSGFMAEKLDENIKEYMAEQIIVFDTGSVLAEDRYKVFKTSFYEGGSNMGGYDMLIYDRKKVKYWCFEIKYTKTLNKSQDECLRNIDFAETMSNYYGDRKNACILYLGKPFITNIGTVYINITDFLLSIDKQRDMDKVMEELTEGLSVQDNF